MPERIEFDVSLGRQSRRRAEEQPMRLLLLGDYSGKPMSERPPLAQRQTHQLDFESFQSVMRRLSPSVATHAGELHFTEIEDFHPDRLFTKLPVFASLRNKRNEPPTEADDSFARLLGGTSEPKPPATPPPADGGLDALIRKLVAPHVVKDAPAAKMHAEALEGDMAAEMRAVLHDPALQRMESVWRGAHWLVSNLELDENLQVHVFDVSRDELIADVVRAGGTITDMATYHALVDRWRNVPGGQGWSALVCLFEFGPSDSDIGLLAALGLVAMQAGGPLIAGADLALVDAQDPASGWQALRRSEVAPAITLAAPRVLLRQPYGARLDAIESFPFEELAGDGKHDQFLWGNPALALALLLGRAFTANGWQMEPGDEREIGEMPAYTFERDGESQLQPCAEQFLTESQANRILDAGIVPIASRRDRNAVVVLRFQSIADPPRAMLW
jgi:type VI secretion system ImpC/EvpB family protein